MGALALLPALGSRGQAACSLCSAGVQGCASSALQTMMLHLMGSYAALLKAIMQLCLNQQLLRCPHLLCLLPAKSRPA